MSLSSHCGRASYARDSFHRLIPECEPAVQIKCEETIDAGIEKGCEKKLEVGMQDVFEGLKEIVQKVRSDSASFIRIEVRPAGFEAVKALKGLTLEFELR